VPGAAVPVLIVKPELPPEVTGFVPNEAVAPAGTPLMLRVTDSAVPLTTAVLIVTVPLAPWPNDRLVGVALIEKSFPTVAPHSGNLNDAIRVRQLNVPFEGMYSFANQKVQEAIADAVEVLQRGRRESRRRSDRRREQRIGPEGRIARRRNPADRLSFEDAVDARAWRQIAKRWRHVVIARRPDFGSSALGERRRSYGAQ
jgi:hypothetical protein